MTLRLEKFCLKTDHQEAMDHVEYQPTTKDICQLFTILKMFWAACHNKEHNPTKECEDQKPGTKNSNAILNTKAKNGQVDQGKKEHPCLDLRKYKDNF